MYSITVGLDWDVGINEYIFIVGKGASLMITGCQVAIFNQLLEILLLVYYWHVPHSK